MAELRTVPPGAASCPEEWKPCFGAGHTQHYLEQFSGRHGMEADDVTSGYYHVALACSCGVHVETRSWEQVTTAQWAELIRRCRQAAGQPEKRLPKLQEVAHAV